MVNPMHDAEIEEGCVEADNQAIGVRVQMVRLAAFCAVVGAALLFPSGALGQAPRSATAQPPVIALEGDFVIEGHVRKPEAFYFLRRTPFGFVIRTLDEDFLDEVVRAVANDPF